MLSKHAPGVAERSAHDHRKVWRFDFAAIKTQLEAAGLWTEFYDLTDAHLRY
jgi:hypothetical protein